MTKDAQPLWQFETGLIPTLRAIPTTRSGGRDRHTDRRALSKASRNNGLCEAALTGCSGETVTDPNPLPLPVSRQVRPDFPIDR